MSAAKSAARRDAMNDETSRLLTGLASGDLATVQELSRRRPSVLGYRHPRTGWSVLHYAVRRPAMLSWLLASGVDPNTRDISDGATALHWAAARGQLRSMRILLSHGADPCDAKDAHEMGVIGWAACFRGELATKRAAASLLTGAGARHHVFSATGLADIRLVRDVLRETPAAIDARQSQADCGRTVLLFALALQLRRMLRPLLQCGADPWATDSWGHGVGAYALDRTSDLSVMRALVRSAERRRRKAAEQAMLLLALIALRQWGDAGRLVSSEPAVLAPSSGVLHSLIKRRDGKGGRWLIDRGADPNGLWNHWGSLVTPLHMAALRGDTRIARLLIKSGADPGNRDSPGGETPSMWAAHFGFVAVQRLLEGGNNEAGPHV